ncbi:ribosomal L27 protein-domain-containing protein [Massariosphaeria phaeospora]|uniref:Large ribosomal subunit protein bL27m n=1 Tax=Massariosphaeria phaeospora TaxID=100035 RepID=A0A7C8ME79_9PLEO|nr:ribosomal L27 protein-domain-containing protein [Massariosphaeria phaeospora]
MLLPRIFAPVRASKHPSPTFLVPSSRVFEVFRVVNASAPSPTLSFARHASHQSQGRANGAKQGPGKRLGAKKSGGEYVIPGNIIFRQRGTMWFPGENCKFGRDHCVFAMESGYVRYYRDPMKHPKRQYIGVALDKEDNLPYPQNAARRRRLNMLAVKTDTESDTLDGQVTVRGLQAGDGTGGETSVRDTSRDNRSTDLVMSKGYGYRQSNWQIGRVAEKAKIEVKKFVPGDRFTAWRRSKARIEINAEKKRLRNASKSSKKTAKPRSR